MSGPRSPRRPTDREVTENLATRLASIGAQVGNVLRRAADRGWLRTDIPFDELVETACVITSVETYVRYVCLDGRTPEEYQSFVTARSGAHSSSVGEVHVDDLVLHLHFSRP